MSVDYRKAPFPWFGGKADAAPAVWAALGDVDHYVEPFAGSLAVLLRRPHPCNRTYYSETVNDVDGLLVNAWRSIQLSPRETAEAASWPVSEADMHARHLALLRWRADRELEHLMGDPLWHDPVMGGWWLWGQSCWIGSGWCSGEGPWVVGADGRVVKREGPGVSRKLPRINHDGAGMARPQLREPGVARQKPHTANGGQGANTRALAEPGVSRQLPSVGDNFHPMTMPELLRWMEYLSARLRHVRILNGDWSRACTSGATRTINVRQGGHVGIFLDPPYTTEAERSAVYSHEDMHVGHAVREWALKRGVEPDTRIVLAGYDVEHRGRVVSRGVPQGRHGQHRQGRQPAASRAPVALASLPAARARPAGVPVVSLYAHRLARIIERRSREAAGELVPLHGRTYAEHEAATGEDAQLVEMRRMLGARWEVER